jgi:hypothetical protein
LRKKRRTRRGIIDLRRENEEYEAEGKKNEEAEGKEVKDERKNKGEQKVMA